MRHIFLILFAFSFLLGCNNQKLTTKETVNRYYKAFDSGDYKVINTMIHDSITIISGDYVSLYNPKSFYQFFKWDSVFKPSYKIVEIAKKKNHILATVTQTNSRNEFLKNNPLVFKVEVSFTSGKISKIKELEYLDVNWKTWNQEKDSLVNWINKTHPKMDGFVNDLTMKGAQNYLKAIRLYEALNVSIPAFLTYGELVPDDYATERDSITTQKFGFKIKKVADCEVTVSLIDSVKTINQRNNLIMKSKYGGNWKEEFETKTKLKLEIPDTEK